MTKQDLPFKPVMAGPAPLAVVHMLWHGTQDDLLHDRLWQRGQTDRPVVPWIFLLAFLVDGCHNGQHSVNWDLPSQPGLLVNNGMWLGEHFYKLPQHSWVDPIQPH